MISFCELPFRVAKASKPGCCAYYCRIKSKDALTSFLHVVESNDPKLRINFASFDYHQYNNSALKPLLTSAIRPADYKPAATITRPCAVLS